MLFKKVSELEIVEKNENMNVLVEEAGAFKKVAINNLGGMGCIFVLDETIDEEGNSTFQANMTYAETLAALNAREILFSIKRSFNTVDNNCVYDCIAWIDIYGDSIEIYTQTDANGNYGHTPCYIFSPDETIYYEDYSDLIGGGGSAE